MAYNDYIELTKKYLGMYRQKQVALQNLKLELEEKSKLQSIEVAAPIAKYSDEPRGGTPELNTVEAAAEKDIELSKEVYTLMAEVGELTKWLKRVNNALEGLSAEERCVVEHRYINRMAWNVVADRAYMSERKARELGKTAVKSVAYMIFGNRAVGKGEYVFIKM